MGACLSVVALINACSTSAASGGKVDGTGGSNGNGNAGTGNGNPGTAGGIILVPDDPVDAGMEGGVIETLPEGFTATEIGGFQLGEELGGPNSTPPAGNGTCANVLLGVVRDFVGGTNAANGENADFQGSYYGDTPTLGLVAPLIGTNQKPTYTGKCEKGSMNASMTLICPFFAETTSEASFDQWYTYTPSVNKPFIVRFFFAPQPEGFTFQSNNFYPLDGKGFGSGYTPGAHDRQNMMHNYSFTTELHTQFTFKGTETFKFTGDDDIWVFLNGHLAVDLGGLHASAIGQVNLANKAEAFGMVVGGTYNLDFFHAERHDYDSNFRIDTDLSFVNCGTIPEDVK